MSTYDGAIDWPEFYSANGVGRLKKSGSKHTGLCPFHKNTNTPAFWFTTANGMWKCEAGCGQGNATTFLAKKKGVSTGEADRMLRELAGHDRRPAARRPKPSHYTLEDYAEEKHLPIDKLLEWGLTTAENNKSVLMPYLQGEAVRRRNPPGQKNRFAWVTKRVDNELRMVGELSLYGLWRLDEFAPDCAVALVEGESDCHALWALGIPALGCPGASSFQPSWCESVAGHRVLIHDEGDSGAESFLRRTIPMLVAAGMEVLVWSTPGDAKDPSDFYKHHQDEALEPLIEALSAATAVHDDFCAPSVAEDTLLGRRGLACPRGWKCDERGVWFLNSSGGTAQLVSATPLVLSRRLIDVANGEEKIELAFLRDGNWQELTAARDEVFSARMVVAILAPRGVQITSESARKMVAWLAALEQANMEALPSVSSWRSLGWCGRTFLPTNSRGGCSTSVATGWYRPSDGGAPSKTGSRLLGLTGSSRRCFGSCSPAHSPHHCCVMQASETSSSTTRDLRRAARPPH